MQRNEIIEIINQKTLEAKKLINEINDLKRQLNNYGNQPKTSFTNEEKVNIFMDYFKGRDSIYPCLSIDKKDSSKKYYIPKCANEWNKNVCNKTMGKKCKDCQYWVDKPIDKKVIRNHLFNNNPIGRNFINTQLREFTHLNPEGVFEIIPEYPEFAWYEGLVNAVTHRDYSNSGEHITVKLFDDRLEIYSRGRLG